MSRKLHKRASGSLDLLLDTMCNAFGSIILVAILIVILSSEVPDFLPDDSSGPEKDAIERQIASAKETIARLQNQLSSLVPDPLAKEAAALRERIEAAKKIIEDRKDSTVSAENYVDVSSTISDLRSEERKNRARIAALENERQAMAVRIESLTEQIAAIADEINDLLAARSQTMRLPREQATSRSPSNIIFLYNEIFWMNPEGNRNTESLRWVESGDSVRVSPLRGQGWTLPSDANTISRFISLHSREYFLSCYVFPDSIEVFKNFRDLAYKQGAEIGWSLESDTSSLVFGSSGTSPKPQ